MHESLILLPNINQIMNVHVQGNYEENSNRKPCLLLKSEINTETETNFQNLQIYWFFFGIKNVRVGGKILGSIGNTHFFWPN